MTHRKDSIFMWYLRPEGTGRFFFFFFFEILELSKGIATGRLGYQCLELGKRPSLPKVGRWRDLGSQGS